MSQLPLCIWQYISEFLYEYNNIKNICNMRKTCKLLNKIKILYLPNDIKYDHNKYPFIKCLFLQNNYPNIKYAVNLEKLYCYHIYKEYPINLKSLHVSIFNSPENMEKNNILSLKNLRELSLNGVLFNIPINIKKLELNINIGIDLSNLINLTDLNITNANYNIILPNNIEKLSLNNNNNHPSNDKKGKIDEYGNLIITSTTSTTSTTSEAGSKAGSNKLFKLKNLFIRSLFLLYLFEDEKIPNTINTIYIFSINLDISYLENLIILDCRDCKKIIAPISVKKINSFNCNIENIQLLINIEQLKYSYPGNNKIINLSSCGRLKHVSLDDVIFSKLSTSITSLHISTRKFENIDLSYMDNLILLNITNYAINKIPINLEELTININQASYFSENNNSYDLSYLINLKKINIIVDRNIYINKFYLLPYNLEEISVPNNYIINNLTKMANLKKLTINGNILDLI